MKYVFYILFSILFLGTVKADTIDNWQVYHNRVRIAAYNQNDQPQVVTIKKGTIKKGDVIIIRYLDDTPCADCLIYLQVEDGKHHLVTSDHKKGAGTILTVTLDKLGDFEHNTGKNYFEFFYAEGEVRNKSDRKLIFKLVIE